MITLVAHVCPRNRGFEAIYLEVALTDVSSSDLAAVKPIVAEAKKLKREVGMVVRQFGGNDYFTYDPANRAQLESQLLGAAIAKATEVHVNGENMEAQTWNKY